MSTEELRERAHIFVDGLMHDAQTPHTGNFQLDAEAFPDSGISADELVTRLTALLEQVAAEAALAEHDRMGNLCLWCGNKLPCSQREALAKQSGRDA